jgi:hypothetical protein
MVTGRLASPGRRTQHGRMMITRHGIKSSSRSGLRTMVAAAGALVCGMCGCERKGALHEPAVVTAEAVPAEVNASKAAEPWVLMEAKGPGRWVAIEGATEL